MSTQPKIVKIEDITSLEALQGYAKRRAYENGKMSADPKLTEGERRYHEGKVSAYDNMAEKAKLLSRFMDNAVDDPMLDATDFAHPAWWRGNDHAFLQMTRKINEILDGKELGGWCREPWESLRWRLAGLAKATVLIEGLVAALDESSAVLSALLEDVQ